VKTFLSAVCVAALTCTSSAALAQAKPATQEKLLFAINEGASGLQDASEIFLKYEEFMGYLGKALGKKIIFHLARDFKSLDHGMQNGTYQLVFVRPANIAAQAVRNYSYSLVVATKGGAAPYFIVGQASSVKTIRDLKGARIALPDENAYMTLLAQAMLREHGLDLRRDLQPSFHHDQAVIGHAVEMGMADVGVVNSQAKIAAEWDKKGGRTPIKGDVRIIGPIIASPAVSNDDLQKLRAALIGLDKTDEGKRMLKSIGVPGFEQRAPEELLTLLQFLGV
jgi:ABC-type phosphate/phosphonate transport system substrate-binding protein